MVEHTFSPSATEKADLHKFKASLVYRLVSGQPELCVRHELLPDENRITWSQNSFTEKYNFICGLR